MAYKMSPRKIIDVLKYLSKNGIIEPHTASYIGAAYIDMQLGLRKEKPDKDNIMTCPTCKQQLLPF